MTLNKGINRNIAVTAIVRELACFMWGITKQMNLNNSDFICRKEWHWIQRQGLGAF